MGRRKSKKARGGLIAKIRKPMAPPSRAIADEKKYRRNRDREQLRRAAKIGGPDGVPKPPHQNDCPGLVLRR